MSEKKFKALDDYLRYFLSNFTKEQKERWVKDNIDLLAELKKDEKKAASSNDLKKRRIRLRCLLVCLFHMGLPR